MTLRDFLLNEARIGDIVIIRSNGWQIGCTMVDNDCYFIDSLNPIILNYEVRYSEYVERDWANKKVLAVSI